MEAIVDICAYLLFFVLMACAVVTDIKKRIIPNWVIFSTVILWLIWKVTLFALGFDAAFLEEAISALGVFAFLFVLTVVSEKMANKYLFGGGDIKLVSVDALFLGIGVAVALFAACLVSLIYADAKLSRGIPFAPCMLCGSLVALIVL